MVATHGLLGRAVVIAASAVALASLLVAVSGAQVAWASPPDVAWIEDVAVHPPGPAELAFEYEYRDAPDSAADQNQHLIALRTASGFDRAPFDLRPGVGFRELAGGGTDLDYVEMRTRYRLVGTPAVPVAVLFLGYQLRPGADSAHQLEQGVAARFEAGPVRVAGEVSAREEFAGPGDTAAELRAGVAVTAGATLGLIRYGVEAFALVPLTGPRLSDVAVGSDNEDITIYGGPSARMNFENFLWISLSAVYGGATDAGAPWMARANVGVQF